MSRQSLDRDIVSETTSLRLVLLSISLGLLLARWQKVYDNLFCQLLLCPASLFVWSQPLLVMSLSICRCFRPLVTMPNLLPSIR